MLSRERLPVTQGRKVFESLLDMAVQALKSPREARYGDQQGALDCSQLQRQRVTRKVGLLALEGLQTSSDSGALVVERC